MTIQDLGWPGNLPRLHSRRFQDLAEELRWFGGGTYCSGSRWNTMCSNEWSIAQRAFGRLGIWQDRNEPQALRKLQFGNVQPVVPHFIRESC